MTKKILILASAITLFNHAKIWSQNGIRTLKIEPGDSKETIIDKAAQVVPTPQQYAYKKLEYTCFIHFGPNTFTRMEWGNGKEDPKIFDLQNLDTDQWCRTMKEVGMKQVVITAKHHDGFVLWQSRYTKHGIMSTPFKDGKGDVLKELSASCQKYGIKLGVYLSPADLYQIENEEGLYGNLSKYSDRVIPRPVTGRPFKDKRTFTFHVDDYNEYFLNQLFELLTEYGPIHEVWFDGAHPKRKGGQKYTEKEWLELIRALAPGAVIFGLGDIRWCGNESGGTREAEWDVFLTENSPETGRIGRIQTLFEFEKEGKMENARYFHYLPAETNTSIREGWFYRDENTQGVRNADDVFDIYERTVGGNTTLLLNIPPNREGRFSDEDVRVLKEVAKRVKETYSIDLLKGATAEKDLLDDDENTYLEGNNKGEFIISLARPTKINRFLLQEAIQLKGQRIKNHALDAWIEGRWQEVANGKTVGYKKILRFPDITTTKLRLRIVDAYSGFSLSHVSAHYYSPRPPQVAITRNREGLVTLEIQKKPFNWKLIGIDYRKNLGSQVEIRYTLDNGEPNKNSTLYTKPFYFASGKVKAMALEKGQRGSVANAEFGMVKKVWTVKADAADNKTKPENAIDADPATFWNSGTGEPVLIIDLKETKNITGFIYTPPVNFKEGLIEKGVISVSKNGKSWKEVKTFDQGNLMNDPTPRTTRFDEVVQARYVQIELVNGTGGSTSATIAEIDLLTE